MMLVNCFYRGVGADRGVNLRRLNAGVPQHHLNRSKIGSTLEQGRRTTVTKTMRVNGFIKARFRRP